MLRLVTVASLLVAIHAPGLANTQSVLYVDDDATRAYGGSSRFDGLAFIQHAVAAANSFIGNEPQNPGPTGHGCTPKHDFGSHLVCLKNPGLPPAAVPTGRFPREK